MNSISKWLTLLIATVCATPPTLIANAQSSSLTVLGPGFANSINDSGQVAGAACSDLLCDASFAAIWNGSTLTVLGSLPGTYTSVARGINSFGQVVGTSAVVLDGESYTHPVPTLWNGTTPNALATLSGTTGYGEARGINDSGQAVGYVGVSSSENVAIFWSGTTPIALTTLGGPTSAAVAINNSSQIVGLSSLGATLWNGSTTTNLPPPSDTSGGTANAINNANQVVGYVSSTELPEIPTLWNGTTPTALGALSGVEYGSVPLGINDAGQIVGVSEYRAPPSHATIWAGNTALDLNTFLSASDVTAGWILASATAISSTGAIVGVAVNQLGGTNYVNEPYAYVLTLAPFAVGCPGANTQAVPYSSTLTALGGTPPYSFSIIGSLPPGLIFTPSTGVVSGTPTAAGVFNFAAQVTDSASNKVENSCVITVTGQTPSVTPVVTGTLGTNGWYVSKTTTLAWTLTGSPTPTTSGCGMVSVPQSTGRTYTCSATNSLGSASDSITIKKDSVPPQVTVKSPVRGKTYTLHEKVLASYSCLDSTSGVATCTGTVKDGAAINTSSKGTKTFNVSGEDKAGNKTKVSVLYNVR